MQAENILNIFYKAVVPIPGNSCPKNLEVPHMYNPSKYNSSTHFLGYIFGYIFGTEGSRCPWATNWSLRWLRRHSIFCRAEEEGPTQFFYSDDSIRRIIMATLPK
jgi:hypothetical protein